MLRTHSFALHRHRSRPHLLQHLTWLPILSAQSTSIRIALLQALAASHPNREVWLQSYYEEKGGIESLGTFKRLTLGEYWALREKGVPHGYSDDVCLDHQERQATIAAMHYVLDCGLG